MGRVKRRVRPHASKGQELERDAETIRRLNELLERTPVDFATIRKVGIYRGFVNDAMRRKVWPVLLGISPPSISSKLPASTTGEHRDSSQIDLDVKRSLWKLPGENLRDKKRLQLRQELSRVIHFALSRNELHYYQGFNDVSAVFLLVLGMRLSLACLERVACNHLGDATGPSLEPVLSVIELIMPLLLEIDPALHGFLRSCEVDMNVAVSWVLTWFAHGIDDLAVIARIYDALIGSHPMMILYVIAVMVQRERHSVMACECEFSEVYAVLLKLARRDTEWDTILVDASQLMTHTPPSVLLKLKGEPNRRTLLTSSFSRYPFDWMNSQYIGERKHMAVAQTAVGMVVSVAVVGMGSLLWISAYA